MRTTRFATLLILAAIPALPRAELRWLSTDYDYGTFKEAAGPQTGSVKAVNDGETATYIQRVRPSCGCTDATYTDGEIMPGDTAVVTFTYDPRQRPGAFDKTVKVYEGDDKKITSIRIHGRVIGAPSSLEGKYPYEHGALRLSDKEIDLGEVRYSTARHRTFHGYNQSSDTIRPRWKDLPPSVSGGISSEYVLPGDIVTFSIYLNTRDEDGPGDLAYTLTLIPDTDADPVAIPLTATVTPDFSRLSSEDAANAPVCRIDPEEIDLGTLKSPKMREVEFMISNTGRSKMTVYQVTSTSPQVKVKRFPRTVDASGSSRCVAGVNLADLPPGAFRLPVNVMTDDPIHPNRSLRIVGIIE